MHESDSKLYYSIKEVSELTELKPYVLRYWESEFPSLSPSKLGFSVENPKTENKLPNGVLVSNVSPESSAGLKGLQSGDLITAINGEVVKNQLEFDRLLNDTQKGSPIFLLVWRNNEKFHLGLVREN